MENQYPDEAKREEIANACNSVIQKPGCKLSEFERVTALKVYNWFANRRKEMKRRANIGSHLGESWYRGSKPELSIQRGGVGTTGLHRASESTIHRAGKSVNQRFIEQEEISSRKDLDLQDTTSLAAVEVLPPPSPTSQVLEQKADESKRETVDEE
ncbi:unnamed protein product [Oncorhynchus mykiss]|uniref:Homeobox domain-containing protein n=1 Tax=Oncorhynchus mykiss TaxID=8022 RepID=A0A060Z2Q1_ONCMY|nr:unnamed protein product [Oncorhynchus mykiss]